MISSSQKLRGWLAFSGVRVGRTGTHAGQAGVQKERDCARREAPRWVLDGGAPAAGTSLGSVLDHRMNTSCSGSSPPPSSAANGSEIIGLLYNVLLRACGGRFATTLCTRVRVRVLRPDLGIRRTPRGGPASTTSQTCATAPAHPPWCGGAPRSKGGPLELAPDTAEARTAFQRPALRLAVKVRSAEVGGTEGASRDVLRPPGHVLRDVRDSTYYQQHCGRLPRTCGALRAFESLARRASCAGEACCREL